MSNVIQSILIRDCEQYRAKSHYPIVLLTTPEEETHVLGLLIGACELAQAGARLVNLGPRLSPDEIIQAAHKSGAEIVALSVLDVPEGNALISSKLKQGLNHLYKSGSVGMARSETNRVRGCRIA